MFSDPQSVTVNVTAVSVPAISRGTDTSAYSATDATYGDIKFTVSHQFKKRNRVVVRLDAQKIVTDPLIPAQSIPASCSAYFVMDFPDGGVISNADVVYYGKAVTTWLTTSTNMARVVAGET